MWVFFILLFFNVNRKYFSLGYQYESHHIENISFERIKNLVLSQQHNLYVRFIDYENEYKNSNHILKNFGRKQNVKLRFIHIPKTGSTFISSVAHFCCSEIENKFINVNQNLYQYVPKNKFEKYCGSCLKQPKRNGDFLSHIPYRSSIDRGRSILFLREPKSRLISQICYMIYLYFDSVTFGYTKKDLEFIFYPISIGLRFDHLEKRLVSLSRENSRRTLKSYAYRYKTIKPFSFEDIDHYFLKNVSYCQNLFVSNVLEYYSLNSSCLWYIAAKYPGTYGCQTKMILGRNCFDLYEINKQDLMEAKRRLKEEFLFIGITERWNESVNIFHQLYGGSLYEDELYPQRKLKDKQIQNALFSMLSTFIEDPWDREIYEFGLDLFKLQKKKVFDLK